MTQPSGSTPEARKTDLITLSSNASHADFLMLPSGRQVVMRLGDRSEEILIQSGSGEVEVSISFDTEGAVAKITGAQLLIESPGKVGISCGDLEIRTKNRLQIESGEGIGLNTGGEMRLRSAEQTFIDGDFVNLNCLSRAGYHDENAAAAEGAGAGELSISDPPDQK
jgi:hypothetical protein